MKVYRKNNYIIIEDSSTNKTYQGLCKRIGISNNIINDQHYDFTNLINHEGLNGVPLNNLLKEDNSPYTLNEWIDFYTENTGNFNSGSALDPQISDALNNANSPSSTNPFLTESEDRIKNITSLNYNSINSTIDITFIDQDDVFQTLTTSFINVGIKYNVLNYNDLLLVTPSPSLYDLAYVRQPQGIQWLPGSLGGTYYSKGLYMFDGVNWVEDDTDMLQALNTLVNTSHTHSNLSILNNITEAFTTSLKSLYDSAETSITNLLNTGQRLITTSEINKLLNTTNINSGDETTLSIQTKRPLKTIEGQSLEGIGNIDLQKSDVGLSNVDNTSDLNKPISTNTQTALDEKANLIHNHTSSDIIDFNTSVDTRIGLTSINVLSDVVITSPLTGQVLKWNGTNWVNNTDNTSEGGSGLTHEQVMSRASAMI